MKHLIALCLLLPSLALAEVDQGPPNVPEFAPAFAAQTRAPERSSGIELEVSIFASGLRNPWGIAHLPGGGYLVTERVGNLRVLGADGVLSDPLGGVPKVHAKSQGGMLDVTLSPTFARDRVIFLTYSKPMGGGRSALAVARASLAADYSAITDLRDIWVQDPASSTPGHYGSRVVVAPDGMLFVTAGERQSRSNRVLAQDINVPYGKILRLTPSGAVPPGNPYDSVAWSYGHRNPQGAAVDGRGRLWAVEHGPAGGDELNLITRGANYGWPVISYGENYNGSPVGAGLTQQEGMEQPVYYWDPVIAPGGMMFYDGVMFPEWRGDAFIASLNPGGLVRLSLANDRVRGEERFLRGMRIRDVEQAHDGAILVLNDRDGTILRLARR